MDLDAWKVNVLLRPKDGLSIKHTFFQLQPTESSSQERPHGSSEEDSRAGRKEHFFNVPTFLTVSGQLHLEVMIRSVKNSQPMGVK